MSHVNLFVILLDVFKMFYCKMSRTRMEIELVQQKSNKYLFLPLNVLLWLQKKKLTYVCDKSFSYLFCCIPVKGMWLNILYQGICSKGTHNFNFLENIFLLFQNPSTRTNVGIFVQFLYVYILASNISSKIHIIIEKGSHKLNFPLKI